MISEVQIALELFKTSPVLVAVVVVPQVILFSIIVLLFRSLKTQTTLNLKFLDEIINMARREEKIITLIESLFRQGRNETKID